MISRKYCRGVYSKGCYFDEVRVGTWTGTELLNAVGSVASVIGLLATFYTLYIVTNLPSALKQHSRHRQLSDLIDRITRIPLTKPVIPDSTVREVEFWVKTFRLYELSRFPFKHRNLRKLIDELEAELKGSKQTSVVKLQLGLIRDEITIR